MRASRLLQILLLLQNRGRLTAPALARELEVDPRTILRDVDAMSQAGLPILTHRGAMGGIELGFNYRTRLIGLAEDEAEALAIWLAAPPAVIAGAIRAGLTLRLRARLPKPVALKPTSLIHGPQGWSVFGPPLTAPCRKPIGATSTCRARPCNIPAQLTQRHRNPPLHLGDRPVMRQKLGHWHHPPILPLIAKPYRSHLRLQYPPGKKH
jgi:hypothetical protein